MRKILVSACLLGVKCRYDGKGKTYGVLSALPESIRLIPVCPEQLGGLPTPRPPAERRDGRVFTAAGEDVTAKFCRGAAEARRLAVLFGCKTALLKERSPSCGHGEIYDGSFTGTLRAGDGLTAEALKGDGIAVCGEHEIGNLL